MPRSYLAAILPAILCLRLVDASGGLARAAGDDAAGVEFYEKHVRPVLAEHCYECHGPNKQEAGLQVDSVGAMLRGGDQGPAVMPGDADASLLVKGIRYDDINFQMPPKGKLPPEKVAAIEKWISQGAPAPADDQRNSAAPTIGKFNLTERAKHWCFQPLRDVELPKCKESEWARSDIDHFILAKLESAKLAPAVDAAPLELLRRVTFDLIGLPPTTAEIEDFSKSWSAARNDGEREAVLAAVVDRLLASPHFGERWARHWLDLVRYAETRGHEFDYLIPNAYQYRDYVIRAFNADVPYDRFVVEHLAGDLVAEPRRNPQTGANESILGTGFWFLGEECHSPVDIRQDETDRVDNKIDVMSKTFLGLTLACARCHDHKFDAISTRDYYAMSGFVLGLSYRQFAFENAEHNRRIFLKIQALDKELDSELRAVQFERWRPVLSQMDRYLSAVRQLRSRDRLDNTKISEDAHTQRIAAVAKQFQVDEVRLAAWLRAFADAANSSAPHDWREFIESASQEHRATNSALDVNSKARFQVVVDYTKSPPWFADGMVFGDRPRRLGELRPGKDVRRPIERIYTTNAAITDTRFEPAETATNETEPGRLNWRQSGRTLKTPTFVLRTGHIAYCVSGAGNVYACVASHRMNNGPLHGGLAKKLIAGSDWTWIRHDLSSYVGQRVHFEFSPAARDERKPDEPSDFGLMGVVELDDVSSSHIDAFEVNDLRSAADATAATAQSMAARVLDDVQRVLKSRTSPVSSNAAAKVDWMIRHPELFDTPTSAADDRLTDYFLEREQLLKQLRPEGPTAPAAWEGSAVDEHVLIRGNHRTVGELVPRRFLEAIDAESPPDYRLHGGRLTLAERLVNKSDPLPARVMVNRLWQHLFGAGLVRTSDNFGSMGEQPSHPELLDHLSRQFMDDGWSVKRMLRRMALSRTYRMSSRTKSAPSQGGDPQVVDPLNQLLHRANVKRLEAEAVRDSILAVSGRLDRALFGPSVEVYLTPFMEGRGRPQSGPLDGACRRSIYLRVRRNFLNPMFQAFDYPTPFTTVGRRSSSNVPAQALALMNGPLIEQQAKLCAERFLASTVGAAGHDRIDRLYLANFARSATESERSAAISFLKEQAAAYGVASMDDPRIWADLCHVLWNTKEFIFIP